MNSPTHNVHMRLSRALSREATLRSQQTWVLAAFLCLTAAVFLNNILGKIIGSNFIRAIQVGAALFLIAMLFVSLLPMKDTKAPRINMEYQGEEIALHLLIHRVITT